MVVYEIKDKSQDSKARLLGFLLYYKESRRFFAEILSSVDSWSAPFLFMDHVKKRQFSIDSRTTMGFVNQRIVPSERQNLGTVLKENGLKSYDEYRLLKLSEGRCAQDDIYLKRINATDILAEIQTRLSLNVLEAVPLSGGRILVFFKDGKSGIVDVSEMKKMDSAFQRILTSPEVFKLVKVSPGGHGVEWGEERFVPTSDLRESMNEIPISIEDLQAFVNFRVLDTSQLCRLKSYTRQYVNQQVNSGKLTPFAELGGARLFLKGEIDSK